MGESLSTLWKETKRFLWDNRYYIGAGLITYGFYYYFSHKYENVSCTKFLDKLDAGEITKVVISGGILQFQTNKGNWNITNRSLISDADLCKMLT